ncbi:MAG TPA: hypothetical protein VN920_00295 [Pyrinomonadaceae bacterium]|nr:hypothetical protein [Pyrinomonadaceae bacterium]
MAGHTKKEKVFESGKTVYEHDASEQLIRLTDYDLAGNMKMIVDYRYTENGENIERLVTGRTGNQIRLLRFEFDSRGREIGYDELDSRNNLVHHCTRQYDRADGKIKSQWHDKDGNLTKEELTDFV